MYDTLFDESDDGFDTVNSPAAKETFSSNAELQQVLEEQWKEKLIDDHYFHLKIRYQEVCEDTI